MEWEELGSSKMNGAIFAGRVNVRPEQMTENAP